MTPASTDAFRVGLGRHLLTGAVLGRPALARRLGDLESAWLRERLDAVVVDRPVWIAGLARAGSTILLEFLAALPGVATHQYRDFPFVHTPWWWRRFLARAGAQGDGEPRERAHGDGLRVTPASPEAMEEVLWASFFPDLHDPARSNVLGRADADTEAGRRFGRFLRDHAAKLLLAEGADRYVAKANYDLTRLGWLHAVFPDARFVVPVRAPAAHVASLVKQHALFSRAARAHPRSVAHLDRVGHFEFGAHRTPVNAGDDDAVARVRADWAAGREARGWARYWAHLYGWLHRTLEADPALAEATRLVRYEELCRDPSPVLRGILEHTGLGAADGGDGGGTGPEVEAVVARFVDRISAPAYYQPDFTAREREAIRRETGQLARALGFAPEET